MNPVSVPLCAQRVSVVSLLERANVAAAYEAILHELRSLANPHNVEGMARYGINPHNTLGVPIPHLRAAAKQVGRNHDLALKLWGSGIHEARILAAFVDVPGAVTEQQMESWVADFDSWDICDQCCGNLLDRTPFAYAKAVEWSARPEEFVKRAGFVLMAELACHDKKASDAPFLGFLPIICRESMDDRNFVKKAVSWALRQIGKRNAALNAEALRTAREILSIRSTSARWIAADALRELSSEEIRRKLR